MPEPKQAKSSGSGLSLQTLLISSASAVVATLVVSQFWEKGTLIFTALVPVIVALVSEALRRPAEHVARVAPLVVPRREAGPTGTAVHPAAADPHAGGWDAVDAPRDAAEDATTVHAPAASEDRPGGLSSRRVRASLITGAAAFVIGGGIVTASELALFDGSVGGGDRRTTLFGGSASKSRDAEPAATATPRVEASDPEPTVAAPAPQATAPPAQEATPEPTATAAPSVSPAAVPTEAPAP